MDLICKILVVTLTDMARPAKPEGQARDKLLQVRVLAREYESFRGAAEGCGLDLSSWVRERLLQAARREQRESKKEQRSG